MAYTLSQAALATKKNKTTIQRAIKSGKISAVKDENGAYVIEPAELHRIFPPATTQHPKGNDEQQGATTPSGSAPQRVSELEKELAVLHERNRGLEAQRDYLEHTVDDLRARLDRADTRLTVLLEDHRQPSVRRGWNFLNFLRR